MAFPAEDVRAPRLNRAGTVVIHSGPARCSRRQYQQERMVGLMAGPRDAGVGRNRTQGRKPDAGHPLRLPTIRASRAKAPSPSGRTTSGFTSTLSMTSACAAAKRERAATAAARASTSHRGRPRIPSSTPASGAPIILATPAASAALRATCAGPTGTPHDARSRSPRTRRAGRRCSALPADAERRPHSRSDPPSLRLLAQNPPRSARGPRLHVPHVPDLRTPARPAPRRMRSPRRSRPSRG